jgi:hypothetical protein
VPNWQNRRKVIFVTLIFCATAAGLVVLSACNALFLSMFFKIPIDTNIVELLTTILYTSAFVATSIIGSYVFGANFDYANSREHISKFLARAKDLTTPLTTAKADADD